MASGLAASVIAGSAWVASGDTAGREEALRRHRESNRAAPDGAYRKDRSRALHGTVRNASGKPVPGALVRCVRLTSLLALARAGVPAPGSWSGLVETEARTGPDGRYEFPYLDEGARALCVSAAGLAPAVQNPIVVQDGAGPRVDVDSARPRRSAWS